jgi:hypothetical protein
LFLLIQAPGLLKEKADCGTRTGARWGGNPLGVGFLTQLAAQSLYEHFDAPATGAHVDIQSFAISEHAA